MDLPAAFDEDRADVLRETARRAAAGSTRPSLTRTREQGSARCAQARDALGRRRAPTAITGRAGMPAVMIRACGGRTRGRVEDDAEGLPRPRLRPGGRRAGDRRGGRSRCRRRWRRTPHGADATSRARGFAGDPARSAMEVGDPAVERNRGLERDVRSVLAHGGEEHPVLLLRFLREQPPRRRCRPREAREAAARYQRIGVAQGRDDTAHAGRDDRGSARGGPAMVARRARA